MTGERKGWGAEENTDLGPSPVLRIPWWALEGLSADRSDEGPDGRRYQVIEIVTDAGVLELLCTASDASGVMASLAPWARRWRLARSPIVRYVFVVAALLLAGAAPLRRGLRRVGAGAAQLARAAGRVERLTAAAFGRAVRLATRPARPLARVLAPFGRRLRPIAAPVARVLSAAGSRAGGPLAPVGRTVARRPLSVLAAVTAVSVWLAVVLGSAPAAPAGEPAVAQATRGFDSLGMSRIMSIAQWVANGSASHLPAATAPPQAAPVSVTDEPPLVPHEVFGFAPYWTIADQATYDVAGYSTIAYFSLTANGDGTLQQSGTGWGGYESQAFADLVTRAHAAGKRVVLTVNCFAQSTLDAITGSPAAQATLAKAIVAAVEAKNLDGVNLDFEGNGSADQAGLTALVGVVAAALRAANPHYQVTMDTYASSAGDPGGFYNIPALAPIVDGFFVMSYDLNLAATATAASPLTSSQFSDATAAAQYAAAVPPSKVILGASFFGYEWPTTNGTMAAQPTGTATPVTYGQVVAAGYPMYWDPITNTAWTSFQVGAQWYEVYFENPASLYMVAHLAQTYGLAGVGAWAMGMDGNDPQMTAALDGNVEPVVGGTGPAATSSSGPAAIPVAPLPNAPGGSVTPAGSAPPGAPAGSGASPTSTTTTSPAGNGTTAGGGSNGGGSNGGGSNGGGSNGGGSNGTTTTTTTTEPPSSGTPPTYHYTATFGGQSVTLTKQAASANPPTTSPTLAGTLSSFTTTDPALACLATSSASPSSAPIDVWDYAGATVYWVVLTTPTDCATVDFTLPITSSGASPASAAPKATGTT